MQNLLEVKGLKKYFPITGGVFSKKIGNIKAVDDVSFIIKKGQIFGLVGESGCGKSTTGRTILNLLCPTSGSVKFKDKIIYDVENNISVSSKEMRKLRKNMQIIFQDPYASLDPKMKVGSIITEGIENHNIAMGNSALDLAKEMLEMCGLNKNSIEKYPHEFSGGERQRICIARSLSLQPEFVVADEPLAALDVSIQAQVLTLMQDMKEKLNLTYLFISHDLGIVRYFCDNIGVMYLGCLVEQASSDELFLNPIHPYTQCLLSAIPKSHPREIKNRIILQGDVPSPANPPSGCKFHTRCPYKMEICTKKIPQFKIINENHKVACHLVK